MRSDVFWATGSYGKLKVCAYTGCVLDYDPQDQDPEYADIARFDVDEWQQEYPDEDISGHEHDIVDFGFWTDTGQYNEPSYEWRKDFQEDRKPRRET